MKEFFKKLKIIWKNPRGRALLQFGLYILFFVILFLLLNIKTSSKISYTVEEQYGSLTEYEYEMVVGIEESIYHIQGRKGRDREEFVVEELRTAYQVLNGTVTDEEKQIVSDKWNLFSPNQLSSFIKNGTVNSTTNYKDGSKKVEYEMECNLWNPDAEGICQLETVQNEKEIVQVILTVQDLYRVEINYILETI